MKKASNSPLVPRPESGSNEGSRLNFRLALPVSTETWSLFPMFSTGLPLGVFRKRTTKFWKPADVGSLPKPTSQS